MSDAKVALVTGSSSGIGRSTVLLLASKGYKVVVTGSKQEKVDRVVKECAALTPDKELQPLGLVLDFSQPDNGELVVRKTVEHFGRLDLLVNNAGIFVKSDANDANGYQAYREVMTINLDTTVRATLAAIEHLKKARGNLIFVSSVASVKPAETGYAYCVSKAAMSMFAKCLALDLAPLVRVNVVSPGPVQTPIFERVGLTPTLVEQVMKQTTLQDRIGSPEEIAQAIYFLASDSSTFVHGHELFIDGGFLLRPSVFSGATYKQHIESLRRGQQS